MTCILFILILYFNFTNDNNIPDNYIAIFNGGSDKITYSTYVYKIDNGQGNYGFEYINTTNISNLFRIKKINITGKGNVVWTGEVFEVAKNNNAYSYVTLPNDNKIYSIEEFVLMFSMD